MGKPKDKMEDYIEDKLINFCNSCSLIRNDVHRLTRTRKLAKRMANHIRVRWKVKE